MKPVNWADVEVGDFVTLHLRAKVTGVYGEWIAYRFSGLAHADERREIKAAADVRPEESRAALTSGDDFLHYSHFVNHVASPRLPKVGDKVHRTGDKSFAPRHVYEVRYVLSDGKSMVLRDIEGQEWEAPTEPFVVVQGADS